MPPLAQLQLPIAIAVAVLVLVLLAERLHERRIRVVAHLATGPSGRPRYWVRWVSLARAIALGVMAWALAVLYFSGGQGYGGASQPEDLRNNRRHVVFAADLSPSMLLKDAGPSGDMARTQRMHEVADAILKRVDGDVLYSVMAFYTEAIPVVLDAEDSELVRNVFNGLPIWYAMESGKTDLGNGVRKTLQKLSSFPEDSVTLFICTDGDTEPLGAIPKLPPSVHAVYVLGVGDTKQGTFIDGHMSRQDPALLGALAGRMRGTYIDVNEKHVSTLSLGTLTAGMGKTKSRLDLADIAIFAFAAGAAVLALLPVLLEYFGSDWKAVRVNRPGLSEG